MDTAAIARPFHGTMWAAKSSGCISKKLVSLQNLRNPSKMTQFTTLALSRKDSFLPCIKATDASSVLTAEGVVDEKKIATPKSTFPTGIETMLRDICEETSVAEVKLKVGKFEMHMKRNIESSPVSSPPVHSPVHSEPESSPPAATYEAADELEASLNSPNGERNHFENSSDKEVKLAFVQGYGANTHQVVSAPAVGVFLRSRIVKGKRRPPVCKEGTIIKEGQLIGFITQFSNDLPVRSTVAGEVIRFLYNDEEPVGYGDPLVAILPSFHGTEIGL